MKSQHIQESDNVHQTQTPTMAFFICLVFDSLFIMHIQKRKEIRLMSVIDYYHYWISIEISYLARVHENCEISTYEWYILWHFEFNFKFSWIGFGFILRFIAFVINISLLVLKFLNSMIFYKVSLSCQLTNNVRNPLFQTSAKLIIHYKLNEINCSDYGQLYGSVGVGIISQ